LPVTEAVRCLEKPTLNETGMFDAPLAALVLLENIDVAGQSLLVRDHNLRCRSGILERSAAGRQHRDYCTLLYLMHSVDQVSPSTTVADEFCVRKVIQIQRSVQRNPKQPDYVGLDVMMSHPASELGGAVTRNFTVWVADQQKSEAQVLKQLRMFIDEQAEAAKRSSRTGKKDE
jgi:hypothetical protein